MAQNVLPLSVARACELMAVPLSTYYYARELTLPGSERAIAAAKAAAETMELRDRIEELCLEFSYYGYRRVTAQLQREGRQVGKKRVRQIMREESLLCHVKKAFVVTTDSNHGLKSYPNLLRELAITGIHQVWVADITYIRLKREFIYLAVILDSYSRRVIGWALDKTMESTLCLEALEMAIARRQPPAGFIHHSDQGSQYASALYTDALRNAGARISMSARGNPYDNARAESFMKTLKQEEVHLMECYDDLHHAKRRIAAFLEDVYNCKRLHSSLHYLPPAEFEEHLDVKERPGLKEHPATIHGPKASFRSNSHSPAVVADA